MSNTLSRVTDGKKKKERNNRPEWNLRSRLIYKTEQKLLQTAEIILMKSVILNN